MIEQREYGMVSFDENGNPSVTTFNDGRKCVATWNDKSQLIESNWYDIDGNLIHSTYNEYDYEKGEKVSYQRDYRNPKIEVKRFVFKIG